MRLIAFCAACLLTQMASAQQGMAPAQNPGPTNAQALTARWADHQFFLRGFPRQDLWAVDSHGDPESTITPGPWTVARIEVHEVDVGQKDIRIHGARMAAVFSTAAGSGGRSLLNAGRGQWLYIAIPERTIDIRVDADATRLNDADLDTLTAKLFIPDVMDLAPFVPDMWKPYFHVPLPGQVPNEKNDGQHRNIEPGHLITTPDPNYSPEARALKLEGTVVVGAMIDKSGNVMNAYVEDPIGAGLDEMSVQALRGWTWTHARDKATGEALQFTIDVEMNFRLY